MWWGRRRLRVTELQNVGELWCELTTKLRGDDEDDHDEVWWGTIWRLDWTCVLCTHTTSYPLWDYMDDCVAQAGFIASTTTTTTPYHDATTTVALLKSLLQSTYSPSRYFVASVVDDYARWAESFPLFSAANSLSTLHHQLTTQNESAFEDARSSI